VPYTKIQFTKPNKMIKLVNDCPIEPFTFTSPFLFVFCSALILEMGVISVIFGAFVVVTFLVFGDFVIGAFVVAFVFGPFVAGAFEVGVFVVGIFF